MLFPFLSFTFLVWLLLQHQRCLSWLWRGKPTNVISWVNFDVRIHNIATEDSASNADRNAPFTKPRHLLISASTIQKSRHRSEIMLLIVGASVLFSWRTTPQMPLAVGDLDLHLTHGSLGPVYTSNSISVSSAVFVWRTIVHTTLFLFVSVGRVYAVYVSDLERKVKLYFYVMFVCVEDSVDQSTVGPWPSATAASTVKCDATPLPPIDNLIIDNMDDLPSFDPHSCMSDDVTLLSKTLIEFLLTRRALHTHTHSHTHASSC